MSQGHADYMGTQGDLHGSPVRRVYHIISGPDLLPPEPYARLLSEAPALLSLAEAFCADYAPNAAELAKWRGKFRAAIRQAKGESA